MRNGGTGRKRPPAPAPSPSRGSAAGGRRSPQAPAAGRGPSSEPAPPSPQRAAPARCRVLDLSVPLTGAAPAGTGERNAGFADPVSLPLSRARAAPPPGGVSPGPADPAPSGGGGPVRSLTGSAPVPRRPPPACGLSAGAQARAPLAPARKSRPTPVRPGRGAVPSLPLSAGRAPRPFPVLRVYESEGGWPPTTSPEVFKKVSWRVAPAYRAGRSPRRLSVQTME